MSSRLSWGGGCFRLFASILATLVFGVIFQVPAVSAQSPVAVRGVVVDQSDGAIAGVRVSVHDAGGAVVQSALTDAAGTFSLGDLAPGRYDLRAEIELFEPIQRVLVVPENGHLSSLTLTLPAAGYREEVVVTGRRVGTRRTETPQTIEVVDATDIERSVASDLIDLLKKNSGVDVVQYNGALSGIGIRGFRPQFSGINKRSLLLIDGRPSGVTNLATLLLDNVERVEVLKGAASSVYGSSAMGGVVNVLTKRSRGKIAGNARVGLGSYDASNVAGTVGGSLTSHVDFDASGSVFDQRDDYRMGNGVTRPATSYKTYNGSVRLGADLGGTWRVDGNADSYRGRDIMIPGDVFNGTTSQGSKDLERAAQDMRLQGRAGAHALSVTAYRTSEDGHTSNVTTTNPLDVPYLPYLSFDSGLTWTGAQAKDSWQWSRRNSLIAGLDYERVGSVSRSFDRTGVRIAPFSADSRKETTGVYAENTLTLNGGKSVVTIGGRLDVIDVQTLMTPLKTDFTPSAATFNVFNPSVGIKQALTAGLRAHFTAGRAFIPAEPSMLTGFTQTLVGGRTQISQGNPDLKPERSTSFDLGAEWTDETSFVDVTYFQTVVGDRFVSNVVISNPPAPAPVVLSVANGLDSHIRGMDVDVQRRLSGRASVFANVTHYFSRTDTLASGAEQSILNVPLDTLRAGIDLDARRASLRVSGRYVHGRQDNNFNIAGSPIIDYDDFVVVDASGTFTIVRRQVLLVGVNNLFDAFYYEKLGYPLQGASFTLSYRLEF
jgi:vitamin B12 transporter